MVGKLEFLQFSEYKTRGIWGIIVKFCMEYSIENWALLYSLPSTKNVISPTLIDSSQFDFSTVDEEIFWDNESRIVYLPIFYKAKKYFVLALPLPLSSFSFFENAVKEFYYYLQMLLAFELSQFVSYPSYFPLLYFSEEQYNSINENLRNKKNVYFLNGQRGTGKKLFVNRFVLFHFCHSLFVEEDPENGVHIYNFTDCRGLVVELWHVPELAVVSQTWQEKIFTTFRNDVAKRFLFISSVYATAVLWKKGFISREIHSLCETNRILLPSLARRKVADLVEYIFSFSKRDCLNASEANNIAELFSRQIEKGDFKENIITLREQLKQRMEFRMGRDEIHGQELKTIVEIVEKEAIRMAYDIVGQSQQKIADYLGISRGSLQYKIKKYELPYQDWER